MERTLLLVDDEDNILSALRRVFRREGYRILCADGGEAALGLLNEHEVGVIVSDQRMPGMSGVDFLSRVKARYPDTVRIVLSGYTELESITEAINRGAIYKFLTKPWEDDLLRDHVREAFDFHDWRRESAQVSRAVLNAKQDLEQRVEQQSREVELNMRALSATHDILNELPGGVLGISVDGDIVMASREAHEVLGGANGSLIGKDVCDVLPQGVWMSCQQSIAPGRVAVASFELAGKGCFELRCRRFADKSRGSVVLLTER